jgi:hypothetical protein
MRIIYKTMPDKIVCDDITVDEEDVRVCFPKGTDLMSATTAVSIHGDGYTRATGSSRWFKDEDVSDDEYDGGRKPRRRRSRRQGGSRKQKKQGGSRKRRRQGGSRKRR